MKVSWYGLHFPMRGVPVTFHLEHDYDVLWRWIIGVQVGSWFFGAVRSEPVPALAPNGTPPCNAVPVPTDYK